MSAAETNADGVTPLGPHCYWFEPHGVMHLRLEGNVERAHAQGISAALQSLSSPMGAYLLRDARKAGIIEPDAREYISKNLAPGSVIAVVSYGASFHTRIVVTMVARAIRLFKSAAPIMVFRETEAEARAWIESHRVSRAA